MSEYEVFDFAGTEHLHTGMLDSAQREYLRDMLTVVEENFIKHITSSYMRGVRRQDAVKEWDRAMAKFLNGEIK